MCDYQLRNPGMPKAAQPAAKAAIADIYNAEDKDQAIRAIKTFERQYGAKFPKAVKKIVDDTGASPKAG